MSEALVRFVEGYRLALAAGDVETLVACYRLPLPVVRPDRTAFVSEASVLRREIGRILDTYRWAGMRSVAVADLRIHGFEPGLDMVSLSWRPLNGRDEEVATIDVTYAVRRTIDGARIAAVMAHNEERRRDPIIRAHYASVSAQVADALRDRT